MGMGSSQVRFLACTQRKNKVSREQQGLSLAKMSLARESQKISKEYNEALSSTVLQ